MGEVPPWRNLLALRKRAEQRRCASSSTTRRGMWQTTQWIADITLLPPGPSPSKALAVAFSLPGAQAFDHAQHRHGTRMPRERSRSHVELALLDHPRPGPGP